MALAFADRVRETTTTTGTGTITLAGAVTGYQSFSAIGNGNTTYYTINAGSQWEVGIGTYTASGTTLSRDTVLSSSNAGSLVDFSAGTKDVFAGYPAGKVVIQDASGNVGIGTASPGAKLDVAGEIRIYPSSSPAQLRFGVSGVEKGKLAVDSSSNMLFETAGSERMRIDSSGSVTANVDIRAPIFYDSANTAYYLDPTGSTSLNVAGSMLASGNLTLNNGANRYVRIGSATNYSYDLQTTGDDFQIIEAGTTPRLTIKYPSGNVGIGTTGPAVKLEVSGTLDEIVRVTSSGSPYISWYAGVTRRGYVQAQAGSFTVASDTAIPLIFATNATERMRIDASGNVGIGVTPTAKLHVAGTIQSQSGSSVAQMYSDGGAAYLTSVNAFPLIFLTNGSERMRIDSSGNLMVGGSTVFGKVSVQGNTNADLDVWVRNDNAGSASRAGIVLNASGNSWRMGMGSSANNSNALTWNVDIGGANTERMRIDTSGNLLVGTTTAQGKLSVNSATGNVGFNTGTSSSPERGNLWYDTDGTGWKFNIGKRQSGSFTAQMTIQDDGSVGIGTTSPSTILHVAGSSVTEVRVTSSGNLTTGAASLLRFGGSNSATSGYIGYGGTASTIDLWNTLAGSLTFGTSNLERMRLTSGGNILVGTTTEGWFSGSYAIRLKTGAVWTYDAASNNQIEIEANLYQSALGVYNFANTGVATQLRLIEGEFFFNRSSASGTAGAAATMNTMVKIDSSGNMGIGTTSPSQRLDVTVSSGTEGVGLGVTNSLAGGYGSGINFYSYRTDGTTKLVSGAIRMFGQANWADATNTSSSMRFYTVGNNTLGERMRIDASGNVGIGTTNVVYPLMVSNGGAAGLEFSPTAVASSPLIQSYNRSGAAYTQLTYSALQHVFWISGTERMRITSAGYVGIGTSSPNGTLTVFNSATFDARTSGINVHRPSSYGQYGSFAYDGGTTYFSTTYTGGGAGVYGAYVFQAYDSTSTPVTRMAIDYLGNVGIGTSSPGSRLTINDPGTGAQFANAASGNFNIGLLAGTGSALAYVYQRANSDLLFGTNNSERMRIDASGNVGIGTSSISAKLHVYGGAGGINSIFDSSTSSDTRIELRNNGTRAGYIYWDSGEVRLLADSSRVTTFYVGGTERFRLTTTGGITSADVADAVGYKGLPQNSRTTGYTLALSDMGKHISITTGNITIPANGSVAFPVGAAVTIFNNSGSTQTISITTDTLRQAGTTNTGTRTLAAYGVATVLKVASTTWVISGNVS